MLWDYFMKTAVLVSYHFPPYGGKAVQRASKLAKYLPQFGWRAVVFSMPPGETGVPLDRTLLADLPADIEIHRPPYRDWNKLIPYDIRKYFIHPLPDKYRPWANAVAGNLSALIRECKADALISTSPTHSAQMLGLAAKKKTGIAWVADFRDPWTGHPDFPSKRFAPRMFEMETEVISTADAVVGVYPKILRDFEGRVGAGKLHLIENGFDEEDFSLVDRTLPPKDDALWMGYNGTVSDFHDPKHLLDPLESAVAKKEIDPASLRLVFTTSESGRKRFAPYRTLADTGVLVVNDYVPHAESLALLSSFDVSLHLLTRGRDIYPGKVFEYLYLGNPVLSLSEPGDDLDKLIESTGRGIVVDHRDPAAVVSAVRNLIERKRAGNLPRMVAPDDRVMRYSRKTVAERYAALLNSLTK